MLLATADRKCDHCRSLSIHVEIRIESNHSTYAFRNNQNMRVSFMFACPSTNHHLIPVYAHKIPSKDHSNTSMHLGLLTDLAPFVF